MSKIRWIKCFPEFPIKFECTNINTEAQYLIHGNTGPRGSWVTDEFGNPYPYRQDLWHFENGKLVYTGF